MLGCANLFSDLLRTLGSRSITLVRITVTCFIQLRHIQQNKHNFLSKILHYTPREKKLHKTLFLDKNTSLFYVMFSFITFRIFLDTVRFHLHIQ
jgi:hypothetical protein